MKLLDKLEFEKFFKNIKPVGEAGTLIDRGKEKAHEKTLQSLLHFAAGLPKKSLVTTKKSKNQAVHPARVH